MYNYMAKLKKAFPEAQYLGVTLDCQNSIYNIMLRVDLKHVSLSVPEEQVEVILDLDLDFNIRLDKLIQKMKNS